MNQAMWISKTGMQAQEEKLKAIANNLANVNTNGFKRDRVVFEDMSYQIIQQPGAQVGGDTTAAGLQMGSGTRIVGTQKVFTSGNNQPTGQSLDIAIDGNGFLQVETPDGETAYTRAGQLRLDENGRLVNMQGLPLQPDITIPPGTNKVTIGENGIVSVSVPGSVMPDEVGQLQLANFINPAGLLAIGDNLYKETVASGEPIEGDPGIDGLGKIKQGALEGSNVQAVEEMIEVIAAQRVYEMNARILAAADNMMQYLSQAAR